MHNHTHIHIPYLIHVTRRAYGKIFSLVSIEIKIWLNRMSSGMHLFRNTTIFDFLCQFIGWITLNVSQSFSGASIILNQLNTKLVLPTMLNNSQQCKNSMKGARRRKTIFFLKIYVLMDFIFFRKRRKNEQYITPRFA